MTNRNVAWKGVRWIHTTWVWTLAWVSPSWGANVEEGLVFFEQKIRPLLATQCYECHAGQSGKKKGGLQLDSVQGLLRGGDSGPVLIAGDPQASLLWRAVAHREEGLAMPPDQPALGTVELNHLATWIRMGLPMPEDSPNTGRTSAETPHWAFQPIQNPSPPAVRPSDWSLRGMDPFILKGLEEQKLPPSPSVDRRTWLRRVTYTLTGLPPSAEEVTRFMEDSDLQAFERALDRILASPHYGERWARHWMDIARYADTKGYVFQSDRSYPYAYTYRDYLVRAFNEDLPYDLFLKQQIAADLMDLGKDQRPLAALGFLTLGRRFLNNPHDIIDDRIDVVFRGTMGLTVACARCHAHKYDPIPIEDYYSLYGVFASSHEPESKPLLGGDPPAAYPAYLAEQEKRKKAYETYLEEARGKARQKLIQESAAYLMAAHDTSMIEEASQKEAVARERQLDPPTVQRWAAAVERWRAQPEPIMLPWITAIGRTDFPPQDELIDPPDATIDPLIQQAIEEAQPSDLKELAEVYGELFQTIFAAWQLYRTDHPGAQALPDPHQESLRQIFMGKDAPPQLPDRDLPRLFEVKVGEKVRRLKRQWEGLDAEHPGAPARAMALKDKEQPVTPVVFQRGRPGNRGAEVPRQFLGFLEGDQRKPFERGSGRLEMAEKIASPTNPLTARVWINRVWAWHFGRGLVDSASDFGLRCDKPVHADLLDYLASYLIEHQWSLKALHREILLSATFRQSSANRPDANQKDPDNRLWWQFKRQRLDLEAMRDTLLMVTDQLDTTMEGRPVDITQAPWTSRRSVYGYIERQNLPNFFRTFDLASPDSSSPGRFQTTVPQQALYLMNSPFMEELVRNHAQGMKNRDSPSRELAPLIKTLYDHFFQRPPSQKEWHWGRDFFEQETQEVSFSEATANYIQALLMSNELLFLD